MDGGANPPRSTKRTFIQSPKSQPPVVDEAAKAVFGKVITKHWIAGKVFLMGLHSFDRAKINNVDSTVGDDRKSSKKYKRKR